MATLESIRKLDGKAFNAEVSKVVTSLKGADKSLVDLVAAAGYRWFDESKDRGSNNVIENLITSLSDFPNMQKKTVAVLAKFVPITFEEKENDDGTFSYTITTVIALKALDEDAKANYIKAIDDFVSLKLIRITDYGKKTAEDNTRYFKPVKVTKAQEKVSNVGADMVARLILSGSTFDDAKTKIAAAITGLTASEVETAKAAILAKTPIKEETPKQEAA